MRFAFAPAERRVPIVPQPLRGFDLDALDPSGTIACTSAGMRGMHHLSAFLGGRRIVPLGTPDVVAVAGWGEKRSGRQARFAAGRDLPFLLLEDGFIRSVGLGKAGVPTVSVVIDGCGVYYDARRASQLEQGLNGPAASFGYDEAVAEAGLRLWRDHRLSKYNTGADDAPDRLPAARRPLILVDQVRGDRSVPGACATDADFLRMLRTALAHRSASEILVRVHPDVLSGYGRGYLVEAARKAGVGLVDPALSTHAVLDVAGEVWTVSSGLGFEAVLRQVPTRVFAAPFYAGWGLTVDAAAGEAAALLPRRTARRTVPELFAATFLHYARYADPVSRRPLTFAGAVERLVDWRRRDQDHASARTYCYGFSRWKRAASTPFLGGSGEEVAYRRSVRLASRAAAGSDQARLAVWGMKDRAGGRPDLPPHVAVVRVEDGFLRSVGLGSSLRPPASLVVDDLGIYYDASRPSRLETLLETAAFPDDLLDRARALRTLVTDRQLTKYNLPRADIDLRARAGGRKVLMVVEQVPGDAALRYGAGEAATAIDLARRLRASEPDAFLVYKEHPDLVARNRRGRQSRGALAGLADLVVSQGDAGAMLDHVDEVHTISSLAGFEALLRDKVVVTWGKPFYAGWGLTRDKMAFERRTRRVTIDELVAAVLILYPRYIDPVSRVPCSVEDYVEALSSLRDARAGGTLHDNNPIRRLLRALGYFNEH